MNLVSKDIEAYSAALCTPEGPVLESLKIETYARATAPQMQIGRIEGSLLRILARGIGAKRVLEIGTFTGYSALCLAEALPPSGQVITCDVDPVATRIAKEHWAKSEHGSKIELRLGPALDTLSKLQAPFDFAFIDADKTSYPKYWEVVAPMIRTGGLVVIDNALWGGSVLDKDPDEDTRAILQVSQMASQDPRFETTLLTVRDGILIALRK